MNYSHVVKTISKTIQPQRTIGKYYIYKAIKLSTNPSCCATVSWDIVSSCTFSTISDRCHPRNTHNKNPSRDVITCHYVTPKESCPMQETHDSFSAQHYIFPLRLFCTWKINNGQIALRIIKMPMAIITASNCLCPTLAM